MKFNLGSRIYLPFTAYFPNPIEDPEVLAYIYKANGSFIEEVTVTVVINDIADANPGVTIYGELSTPKDQELDPGSYYAVVTLASDNPVEIMRLPFEVTADTNPVKVLYTDKQYLSTEEQMTLLGSILKPGIVKGFDVTKHEGFSDVYDIHPGIACTEDGHVIELKEIAQSNQIPGTINTFRMDAIAIKFNQALLTASLETITGEESFVGSKPPLIPVGYIVLAYINHKPGESIIISTKKQYLGNPIYNVTANEKPNGARREFSFPVSLNPGFTIKVDGIPQIEGEDYMAGLDVNNRNTVTFVDEVPGEGQWVSISGEANYRTAYNQNWRYCIDEAAEEVTWLSELAREHNAVYLWKAADYENGRIVSTGLNNKAIKFNSLDLTLLNYNPRDKYFLRFGYDDRASASLSNLSLPLTIALQFSMPSSKYLNSGSWYSLFTLGDFSLILIYGASSSTFKLRYKKNGEILDANASILPFQEAKLLITIASDKMSIDFIGLSGAVRMLAVPAISEADLVIGDVKVNNTALPVKWKGMAIFNGLLE